MKKTEIDRVVKAMVLEGFLADRPSLDQVQGSGILALPGSEGALDRASSSGRM